MRGNKVTMHGTGQNTRNFLYVEDVARAFEVILFKGRVGSIYNIGGSNEQKNIDVARGLIALMGFKNPEDMMTFVEDRVFNDLRYFINSDKLHELGWKEQMTWEEGLKHTVSWYKNFTTRYGNIDTALVAHPREGLGKGTH